MTGFSRIITKGGFGAMVVAVGLAVQPLAAAAAEAVHQPYDPPVGSRWTIVSEGREEKTQDGKSTATTSSTRTEELTIVEKTADGYRISTALRDYDMHGEGAQIIAANALLGALRDVVVTAIVDRGGKPVRIENLDEVVAAHKRGFERMLGAFKDKPEAAAKIRELLEPILTRTAQAPDEAAQWYLETMVQLSAAQDTDLGVGEERRSAKAAPNPFGGEPIKTNTVLRLVEADAAAGKAKLVLTQAYDPVALKEFTAALAKKIVSGNSLEEMQKVMNEMSLSIDDRTEFVLEHGMTRSLSEDSLTTVKALGHAISKHERNQITVAPMP